MADSNNTLIVPVRILDSPQLKRLLRNFRAGVKILAMLHVNLGDRAQLPLRRAEIRKQLMRAIKRFHTGFNVSARSLRRGGRDGRREKSDV